MREEEIIVGGQAVIEGVMMRTPNAYAVAVRRADGQIVSKEAPLPSLAIKYPLLKLPVLRGSAMLLYSMALGVQALNFSASVAMADEKPAKSAKEAKSAKDDKPSKTGRFATVAMILPALAFNLVIFIFIPLLLTNLIFSLAQADAGTVTHAATASQLVASSDAHTLLDRVGELFATAKVYLKPVRPSLLFNLVDGLIRMVFFLTFIALISRMKDIKRVFQYHGAEHKVVYNWESRQPLTVENARRQPRQHPRCGTSFLMIVMLVSIGIFSIIKFDALAFNFLARVVLIPLVAGLSYEFIRFSAKCQIWQDDAQQSIKRNWQTRLMAALFAVLTAPGLWLQNITTQEPSDDQLEVAIYALKRSLGVDSSVSSEPLAAD